ncbi:hypothetical protein P167DRAFT_423803 [Morchella conica CCBAS932]|uniref:Uncharacterized protein n=1 Tax=Morchella conica CCBAS932 TaxID=1392247 RepID=A0A3N4KCJ8_9PEZI|nr:hypothetical protein P167DRAFT_423803 [Morchella conica CCBAS932]
MYVGGTRGLVYVLSHLSVAIFFGALAIPPREDMCCGLHVLVWVRRLLAIIGNDSAEVPNTRTRIHMFETIIPPLKNRLLVRRSLGTQSVKLRLIIAGSSINLRWKPRCRKTTFRFSLVVENNHTPREQDLPRRFLVRCFPREPAAPGNS